MVRPVPQGLTRAALAALGLVAAVAALAVAPQAHAAGAAREAARPPARWVRVSVATLWVRPGEARAVDAPALACPADPRAWVGGMSVTQKRWLVGRLETQALYGAKVYLLGTSGGWSHVAVAGQPTRRNRWGYPGWVPARQLTDVQPEASSTVALVRPPTMWVYDTPEMTGRVLEVSCGTRLPVVSSGDQAVEVLLQGGAHAYVRRAAVALHETGTAWPRPTGAQLVKQARRFAGLGYLWAGASGFCVDCSGLTELVYGAFGATVPRDAADQATVGATVATRGALRAGDLVFFRNAGGAIHHVGLAVGDGTMIHAPSTGGSVTTVSLSAEPYRSEFAGGRRPAQ
jgi:gamma-D-glutamyl-L-lysine dipeptidyl-peptidase